MKARVLSVYDDGSLPATPLIGAKGLAILVEADGERTLFDTGMRGSYLMHNMDFLKIDPDEVDRIVISHMHNGHIGGLPAFLEARKETIDVIAPPDHGAERRDRLFGIPVRRTGFPKMPPESSAKMNVIAVSGRMRLSENLYVTVSADDPSGMRENSLVLMTKGGPVLICGCCHAGQDAVISGAEEAAGEKVRAVIGGMHLTDKKKAEVYAVAESLKEKGPPALHLCHCTGTVQKMHLRERLGLKAVNDFYAGTEIQFDV